MLFVQQNFCNLVVSKSKFKDTFDPFFFKIISKYGIRTFAQAHAANGMSPNSRISIQPASTVLCANQPASQCYFFSLSAGNSQWLGKSQLLAAMHDGAVTYRLVCATRRAFAARTSVAGLAIEAPPRLLSFSTEPPRETCLLQLSEERAQNKKLAGCQKRKNPSLLHTFSGQLSNLKQVQTRKNKKVGRVMRYQNKPARVVAQQKARYLFFQTPSNIPTHTSQASKDLFASEASESRFVSLCDNDGSDEGVKQKRSYPLRRRCIDSTLKSLSYVFVLP